MPQLIADIKAAGIEVYGLTNWAADTYETLAPRFPFLNLLDGVVVSGQEGLQKPDPEIYRRTIERFNLDPAQTVFFDDTPAISIQRNSLVLQASSSMTRPKPGMISKAVVSIWDR